MVQSQSRPPGFSISYTQTLVSSSATGSISEARDTVSLGFAIVILLALPQPRAACSRPDRGPPRSPQPDTPRPRARGAIPAPCHSPPPDRPTRSPRPSAAGRIAKPSAGFGSHLGADAGGGPGLSPTGGLGSHRPRGGTRTEANSGIIQHDQRLGGNSLACP